VTSDNGANGIKAAVPLAIDHVPSGGERTVASFTAKCRHILIQS